MIPYCLQFSGIRDYKPTKLKFGGLDEHILITGPNGTGKSTLTFCMGAVLYSAKVDLEGLRSNNLPENDPWKASIQLTFKNEGPSQIDAPPFIAFKLLIEQPNAHAAIQKEYHVLTGETLDTLQLRDTYRSGNDHQKNFSAYKDDLQHKYKIQPDIYYLIWYQKEVNQFAAMSPEERFRRFSEMYNITAIQAYWESCMENVKELSSELERAKAIVKGAEINVKIAQNELTAYQSNRQRFLENGQNHILYSLTLRQLYEERKHENEVIRAKNIEHLEESKDQALALTEKIQQLQIQLNEKKAALQEKEFQFSNKKSALEQLKSFQTQLQQEVHIFQNQLAETEEQRKNLRFTEEETIEKYNIAKNNLISIDHQLSRLVKKQQVNEENKIDLLNRIAEIQQELNEFEKQKENTQALLSQYVNSHHVQTSIHELQMEMRNYYKQEAKLQEEIAELQERLDQLVQNKFVSKRQQEALDSLKHAHIEAYTIPDLLQLEKNATIKDEAILNTIKYTIFYDALFFRPENDLYYVSLKKIMPERFITSLPSLKLIMRSDLNEKQQNFATKVLWWIDQFFKNNATRIERGILVDGKGSRGKQEKNTFILLDRAITEQKQKLESSLHIKKEELQKQREEFLNTSKQLQHLYSVVEKVIDAEKFELQLEKQNEKNARLKSLQQQLSVIQQQHQSLQQELVLLQEEKGKQTIEMQWMLQDIEVYQYLSDVTPTQKKLQRTLTELNKLVQKSLDTQQVVDTLQTELYALQETIRKEERNIGELTTELEETQRRIYSTEKFITDLTEKIEVDDAEIARLQIQLEELKSFIPDIYKETAEMSLCTSLSIHQLIEMDAHAKAAFEDACNEKVNPQAQSNFTALQKDFEQKKEEVTNYEQLLAAHKERAEESEIELETAINTQITKIDALFQNYMNAFQIEGQIDYERVEDKQGRSSFKLYIKVRKSGHNGPLVDVSLKARNGKVAKGVSGGEESLSSLLFALTLLRNLNISPSYIVLDEFDSALDESRKEKVFDLYASELNRKLFILSPKAHEDNYYARFSKVFVVEHDSTVPVSIARGIYLKQHI